MAPAKRGNPCSARTVENEPSSLAHASCNHVQPRNQNGRSLSYNALYAFAPSFLRRNKLVRARRSGTCGLGISEQAHNTFPRLQHRPRIQVQLALTKTSTSSTRQLAEQRSAQKALEEKTYGSQVRAERQETILSPACSLVLSNSTSDAFKSSAAHLSLSLKSRALSSFRRG